MTPAAEVLSTAGRPDTGRPPLPTGPPAAEVWDAICRGMGIKRLSPEEAAALPPWTEAEAAAFERAVAEAGGEAVDERTGRWPPLPTDGKMAAAAHSPAGQAKVQQTSLGGHARNDALAASGTGSALGWGMKQFSLAFTLCGLALAGCATGKNVIVTNPAAVRSTKPAGFPVQVFLGGEMPTRPFTTVAVAQVAGDENDLRENVEELQQQARKLGADAVIVKNLNTVADRGPFRTTYQTVKEGSIIVYR